jgi:hypothetical protein
MRTIFMSALLAAGLALAPWAVRASGDQPGGGGPSANVPPVGAGGTGPTESNVGNRRYDLRLQGVLPGPGYGGAVGPGQGGGVIESPLPPPSPGAPKQ